MFSIPDKAVVDRLVRTIGSRRITPAQAVPDHEDDATHNPPVIDPRDTVRQWKIGLDPAHLRLTQHPDFSQRQRLLSAAIELTEGRLCKRFNGS